MDDKYNDWGKNSQAWQDELEKALENYGGDDLVTQYTNVAFAFPSNNPNQKSFDYPLIDQQSLDAWAESKGWKTQLAPEMSSEEDKDKPPPVRFTKI